MNKKKNQIQYAENPLGSIATINQANGVVSEDANSKELNTKGNAYALNRYLCKAIRKSDDNTLLTEAISFEPSEDEKGGIIVFSIEVNAVKLSDNKFLNKIKQKLLTTLHRLTYKSKVDKIANDNELVGWTIGKYLNGRYTAKDGKTYGEDSLSLEIIGVTTDTLIKIAEELCVAFKQESCLVKDYSKNRVFFVEANLDESYMSRIKEVDNPYLENSNKDRGGIMSRIKENVNPYLKEEETQPKLTTPALNKILQEIGLKKATKTGRRGVVGNNNLITHYVKDWEGDYILNDYTKETRYRSAKGYIEINFLNKHSYDTRLQKAKDKLIELGYSVKDNWRGLEVSLPKNENLKEEATKPKKVNISNITLSNLKRLAKTSTRATPQEAREFNYATNIDPVADILAETDKAYLLNISYYRWNKDKTGKDKKFITLWYPKRTNREGNFYKRVRENKGTNPKIKSRGIRESLSGSEYFTKEEIKTLPREIEDYLQEQPIPKYYDISVEDMGDKQYVLRGNIDYGDISHDHRYFDNKVKEFFDGKGISVDIYEPDDLRGNDDGDGIYSSAHIIQKSGNRVYVPQDNELDNFID